MDRIFYGIYLEKQREKRKEQSWMVLSVNALFSLRPLFALDEVGQEHELHQRQRRDLRRLKVMRQMTVFVVLQGKILFLR